MMNIKKKTLPKVTPKKVIKGFLLKNRNHIVSFLQKAYGATSCRLCGIVSCRKGSLTVEAAFSLSFFVMMLAAIISLFAVLNNQIKKEYELSLILEKAASAGAINAYGAEELNTDNLNNMDISIAGNGIKTEADEISVSNTYIYHAPFLPWNMGNLCFSKQMTRRMWTGRVIEEETPPEEDEGEYVYITEHGTVYHTHTDCNHLKIKISAVSTEDVGGLRNIEGKKYYPCEVCGGPGDTVYISGYGVRYHEKDCPELYNNYKKVKKSETTLPECSKCRQRD